MPASWPPEFLDAESLQFTIDRLHEGPRQAGWWLHFVLVPSGQTDRTLIGSAGYAGPPSADGTVEIGYAIVRDHQRRGYASEVVRALVANAFAEIAVQRVVAQTLPDLIPSIGVLNKCGFHLIGEGSGPGSVRFELTRVEYVLMRAKYAQP